MRTDRKRDLDKYYNDHLKMGIIRRLQLVDSWKEIKGIESAVYEALQNEEMLEKIDKVQFEDWKKEQEKLRKKKNKNSSTFLRLSWIRGHWPRIFLIQLELRQIVAGTI